MNDPETPEKTKEYLAKINTSAEHLLDLINDILDMSRIESGRFILKNEEFSFSKMLESINTMFSGQCLEKNQNYSCNIKGQVDDYYIGDNMKLRQILINILGNAVKFTPEGGNISLDIQRIAQFDDRSTLQFTIRDNGIGMSEDFLPHIFDTFAQEDATSTNKYGSSGLGLAITKNIIEMMNGTIQVESKKGDGTTFTVSVTLNDSEHKDTVDEELKIHPGDMSVLIIDDDPKQIYSLNEYFTAANNSYQAGQVSYLMEELADGQHSLSFRAWDLLNNSTTKTLSFIVEAGLDPSICSVTTYPNPVQAQGIVNMTVNYDQPDELLQTELYLFNTGGQMVYRHTQDNPDAVSINLPSLGLQPGIYVYSIKIKSASSKYSTASGKIIVTR
jgi:two-component sensor histidine kinase